MKRIVLMILAVILFIASSILSIYYSYNNLTPDPSWDLFLAIATILSSILLLVAVLLLYTHSSRSRIKSLENRLARWSKLSPRVNQIGENAFHDLPVGIIVLDETTDEIKWVNQYARLIFDQHLIDQHLLATNEGLYNQYLNKSHKETVSVKSEQYDSIYQIENQVIYLFNVTPREKLKKEYFEHLPALGILYLDSFEENLSGFDISEQSSIKGEYLSAVADWIENFQGYLKPFGENRFIMITNRKRLLEMMERKFDILEKVRDISIKYNIRITLSMGIASWDVEYDELNVYAQNAIELAEKRGGDQVVVNIQNQKIAYFGAKLDASSKNSRVGVRFNANRIRDLVEEADRIYIQGHTQVDLDSFGSMIATYKMALASNNKEAYLIVDKEKLDASVSYVYRLLENENHPILSRVLTTSQALATITKKTLNILVDTQAPVMVHSIELIDTESKTIVIDHHRSTDQSIQGDFSYVDAAASSTIELIMELLQFFTKDVEISATEASIMYAGLVVDTNTFTYRTTPRTFEVAAKLKEFGADTVSVKLWLRNDYSYFMDINKLIEKAQIFLDRFIIVTDDNIYPDRTFLAKVSQHLLEVKDIDAAFTIVRIEEDVVGISARSYKDVNVQIIMEELGGGGHLNSAATQIKGSSVAEVYEQLKYILELEYGQGGERMKVILLEDVKNKGKKEDIIEVASGYALYLKNNKLAIDATDENIKKLEEQRLERKKEEEQHLNLMNKLKSEIDGKSVTLTLQVGQDGKYFGSITTKQIVDAFQKTYGTVIDKKKVELSSAINSAGIYTAFVVLHPKVKAQFEVNIVENR